MNGTSIEILDEQGHPRLVSAEVALALTRRRIAREDRQLGLQRQQIPVQLITLPGVPAATDYARLTHAIDQRSTFSVRALNLDQALMMRCFRCYWNAKAISFPNLIYNLIPDPTADGAIFSQILPRKALENLRVDLAADKALYDLLQFDLKDPQQSAIRAWLRDQEIDCPFATPEAYFLAIVRNQFQWSYEEALYTSDEPSDAKRERQAFHRQCWKYLSHLYDPQEQAQEIQAIEAALRNAEWEGYALRALRTSPQQGSCKSFKQLWKRYLKTQRATLQFLATDLHWINSIPNQRKKTNDVHPIKGILTPQGYIEWICS